MCPAGRVPVRPSRSRRVWWRLRSAPTRLARGRVPAGFNNIVGLKPTRGLISAAGVVPACRTLDCVSIFALTADDAMAVLRVAAGPDAGDPYSRTGNIGPTARPARFRFALPGRPNGNFSATKLRARIRNRAARLTAMGGVPVEFDYAPFLEIAKLLYDGPWVAERYAVVRELHAKQPDAFHPVTRKIIENGIRYSAADAFTAFYRLEASRAQTRGVWERADILAVPTSPTAYTVAEVEADPIQLNANLGYYTNFVNLLDLSAIAVPSGFRSASAAKGNTPVGLTLIAPPFGEAMSTALGGDFHARAGVSMGATGVKLPGARTPSSVAPPSTIELAVVGAHLSGQPLNHQLTSIDASDAAARGTASAKTYRLYALPGEPARPGLVRVSDDGAAIACEVWSVLADKLGRFVAGIPAPARHRQADAGKDAARRSAALFWQNCSASPMPKILPLSAAGGPIVRVRTSTR